MELSIHNIIEFKITELGNIFCFFDIDDCLNCYHVCSKFAEVIKTCGFYGVTTFSNKLGISYGYYIHYNIFSHLFLFSNVVQIYMDLNSIYDVSFLFKLIESNNDKLQNLCVHNHFLINTHTKLIYFSEIVKKQKFTQLQTLACTGFQFNTLEYFMFLFSLFKNVVLNKCDVFNTVFKFLVQVRNKLVLLNIQHIECTEQNAILVSCIELHVEFSHFILKTSRSLVSKLISSPCTKITIHISCFDQLVAVLPTSVEANCIWEIIGFKQMLFFLTKYCNIYFKQLNINFMVNVYIGQDYSEHMLSLAKILLLKTNYRLLIDKQRGFLTIWDVKPLTEHLQNVVLKNNVNLNNLTQKMVILFVKQDSYSFINSQNLMIEYVKSHLFFQKLFKQIAIIK